MALARIAAVSAASAAQIAHRIDRAARAARGHSSLGAATWRALAAPGSDAANLVAYESDEPVALLNVDRSDTFAPRHWALGLTVLPSHQNADAVIELLRAGADHVSGRGGGSAVIWILDPDAAIDALAARASFVPQRDLLQMRVPLPLREEPRWPPGIETRTFEPGRDEQAWLTVNNRAFGNHPEQGGWVEATLHRRMSEPWFDPQLFLLAFDSEGLVGSNWLKLHERSDPDPPMGEIFVIGVDPRAQGTGLGRALAIAGLDLVAARGVTTGLLYVAAENESAVRLYESLGFAVHRVDRAYAQTVPASES